MQQNSKIYIELDRDELITEAMTMLTETTTPILPENFWNRESIADSRTKVESDFPKDRLAALVADRASQLLGAVLIADTVKAITEAIK